MLKLKHSSGARPAGRSSSRPQAVARVPRSVVLRAVEQETTQAPAAEPQEAPQQQPNGFDFSLSRVAADGFVEKDTAGQANMVPTLTRPFEAGSAEDTVQNQNFNNGVAAGAAVVSAALVGVGLLSLSASQPGAEPVVVSAPTGLLTLSEYSSKFSAELGLAKVAPAPPVAVEEPAPAAVAVEAAADEAV